MRGRTGCAVLLIAALAVGCQNKESAMTAEQKRQAAALRESNKRAEQQRQAEAKANREREAAQAKEDARQARVLAKQQREQAKKDDERRQQEARETKARDAKRTDEIGHEIFVLEGHQRYVDQFAQAQAADGAAEDAMLGDAHFDAGELNSLGRYKLNLILRGAHGKPATVYLISADKDAQARAAAVDRFWKESQYGSSVALTAKEGFNPDGGASSNVGLNGLRKLDKMSTDSGGSPTLSNGGETGGSGGRGRIGNLVQSLTGGTSGGQ